jgi:lipopolysaccharide biosynthesis regulator YciM
MTPIAPIVAGVGWYIIHKNRKQDKKDEESPFGQSVAGLRAAI